MVQLYSLSAVPLLVVNRFGVGRSLYMQVFPFTMMLLFAPSKGGTPRVGVFPPVDKQSESCPASCYLKRSHTVV